MTASYMLITETREDGAWWHVAACYSRGPGIVVFTSRSAKEARNFLASKGGAS